MRILAPRILVLAVLLLLVGGQEAMAQGGDPVLPRVAVMDFTGFMLDQEGNSVPLGKAVSSMLTTELSDREGMRVIERQNLQTLLQEQRLALSGRLDESTAIEIGKMLGVQYVVLGAVLSMGPTARIDIRIVDAETSEVYLAQKVGGETVDLLSLVVQLANNFSQKLELESPSDRAQSENIPVQATIAFSRGVDFEDKGETEQAIEQYQRALELHPGHRDAQKALARLQGGGEDR